MGGRFSVWSAIGVLPLSVHFGYDVMEEFLKGGHSIDHHLLGEKDVKVNILNIVEKFTSSIRPRRLLSNIHSKTLSKSHNSLLPSVSQIRPTHPTTRHVKQRKTNQHKRIITRLSNRSRKFR